VVDKWWTERSSIALSQLSRESRVQRFLRERQTF
jgi:hypothetical protein